MQVEWTSKAKGIYNEQEKLSRWYEFYHKQCYHVIVHCKMQTWRNTMMNSKDDIFVGTGSPIMT